MFVVSSAQNKILTKFCTFKDTDSPPMFGWEHQGVGSKDINWKCLILNQNLIEKLLLNLIWLEKLQTCQGTLE